MNKRPDVARHKRRWRTGVAATGAAVVALVVAGVPAAHGVQSARSESSVPPSTGSFAALNPVTPLTAATFAQPPQANMPWARWNFPPATATIEGLKADVDDAYDHNIGGLEIGQGGMPTNEQLIAIYHEADSLGITISLKVASGLPNTTYPNTDQYARRTLAASRQTVRAGQSVTGAVPGSGSILAVLAYRCATAPCAATGTVALDRSSVKNLTSTLTGTDKAGYQGLSTAGNLDWTAPSAPSGAQWVVLTFREVPFGDTPETLSPQGTSELIQGYNSYLSGELGSLVKQNAGDFFVDSHASDPWGAPEELWASNMQTQFQQRAGYDIVPDLAALLDPTMAGANLGGGTPTGTFYSFTDGSASAIRSDFNKVRSDLYTANRLTPFQNWAHTYNMKLRLQQEDGPITSIGDQLQTSSVLDRSEYESLTGSDQTDIYRPMASALHMTGNSWYSTECCAVLNESYVETLQDQIIRMNHEFAGGVNRIVYHIRPYIDTPTTTWPGLGFSASKVSFANANNRTEPNYVADDAALNNYFARMNEVLTQGQAKVDVAVYQRNYSSPSAFSTSDPNNRHWEDLTLQRTGYTWDYLDESLFNLPNATVDDHRLASAGPGYRALILDANLLPSTNTARGTMTLDAAEKFLSYAKAGLPVIFVGKPTGTGSLPKSQDAQLAKIVKQILALPDAYGVSSEGAVPRLLTRLGITPQAKPTTQTSLLSQHRLDSSTGTDYYYLYNEGVDAAPASTSTFGDNPSNVYEEPSACTVTAGVPNPCMATGKTVDTDVTLEGQGVPYLLDAFSGKATPITDYSRKGDAVTVHVHLARDASMVIALADSTSQFGVSSAATHVVKTSADGASQSGTAITIQAAHDGVYRTTLSNGQKVTSRITSVPSALNLTKSTWSLAAEDWQPTNPYGTTGAAGSQTTKVPVSVTLAGLTSWPNIPALKNASGIGSYSTSFELPAGWTLAKDGAALSLGQVTDSFDVRVNGHPVAVDQIAATADIAQYLHAGTNYLTVRVATTLNNRLAALDSTVKARGITQQYGLIGPVTVTPYGKAQVSS